MTKYSALFSTLRFSFPDLRPTLASDATDFTVAADAKANVGSSFSYTVPAKGLLIVAPFQFAAKSNTGASAYAYATWGVRIASTDYFPRSGQDIGASGHESNYRFNMNQAFEGWLLDTNEQYNHQTLLYRTPAATVLHIENLGIPTGVQTVQLRIWNKKGTSIGNTLNVRGSSVRPLILGLRSIAWN